MGYLKKLIDSESVLILDGALGTELELQGYDISDQLWSARILLESPEVIEMLHREYLLAGADLLTTASYQATIPGLLQAGLSTDEARHLITMTVDLAKRARDQVWNSLTKEQKELRVYPLIGGDIGPYAAYLANASEYTGNYGLISERDLYDFHLERIKLLLEAGCDFLILETIPNYFEVKALVELLTNEFPNSEAFLSVTTLDGHHLPDGHSLELIAELVEVTPQIVAVGINCSMPQCYPDALCHLAKKTDKPLLAYPNSGEVYDSVDQSWKDGPDAHSNLSSYYHDWKHLGLKIMGGCCRTRPADIACLRSGLVSSK